MNYQHINWLFDLVMPRVSNANAFKIICIVARKTWGWGKNSDMISVSQFKNMTGIKSKTTVLKAIKDAVETGYIVRKKVGQQHVFRMNVHEELVQNLNQLTGTESIPLSHITGTESKPTGTESIPELVQNLYPQREHKENSNSSGSDFALAVVAYESNIGSISKVVSDVLEDAVDEFGSQWVIDAIGIAAKNNVRKWSYVNGILKKWREGGRNVTHENGVTRTDDGGMYV